MKQIDQVISLVVDEADRMVEKGHYEELTKLFEMINKSVRRTQYFLRSWYTILATVFLHSTILAI